MSCTSAVIIFYVFIRMESCYFNDFVFLDKLLQIFTHIAVTSGKMIAQIRFWIVDRAVIHYKARKVLFVAASYV